MLESSLTPPPLPPTLRRALRQILAWMAMAAAWLRRVLDLPSPTLPASPTSELTIAVPRERRLVGGRYALLQPIGKGGMAEVHLAMLSGAAAFEKPVVVKLLRPTLANDPTYARMMLNEARLAARLNHANIVQVIDVGTEEGEPFIVMEYVDGQDLRRILRRATELRVALAEGVACRILADTLAALHHAHSQKEPMLHRDVSPQNILVTYCGGVKLVDFGIAKALGDSVAAPTRVGQWKGTFSYMSPEQIRHEPLDARSDVFATGIVLWELLCGRRLFRQQNHFDTMHAICNAPAPPPSALNPNVPPELDRIVSRALARKRAERYPTAQKMRADLEELIWRRRWRADPLTVQELMATLFAEVAAESPTSARTVPVPSPQQNTETHHVVDAETSSRVATRLVSLTRLFGEVAVAAARAVARLAEARFRRWRAEPNAWAWVAGAALASMLVTALLALAWR